MERGVGGGTWRGGGGTWRGRRVGTSFRTWAWWQDGVVRW